MNAKIISWIFDPNDLPSHLSKNSDEADKHNYLLDLLRKRLSKIESDKRSSWEIYKNN